MEKDIERLIQDYGNDVLRLSYMYLKDKQLAEDAFQEVFIKIYHKWDSFRHESSEKTWIIRITVNVCKDMLKNNWIKKVSFYDTDDIFTRNEGIDYVEEAINKKEIYQGVLTLPDKYKEVILLYYYNGFSVAEIASILETTTGTVGSLLSRARSLLKQVL
ncbi:sigma-70 family RNA polymerase sigma factor [Mycoplasmatota bacterium]|nr:sigma-70 family RNA polymerase sigma factor [Mycoplasmatota bacterium]